MLSNLPPAAELSDPPVAADTSKLNIYIQMPQKHLKATNRIHSSYCTVEQARPTGTPLKKFFFKTSLLVYSEILEVLPKTAASAKGKKAVTASNKLQEESQ